MKKLLLLMALMMVASLLISVSGEIYETNQGKIGTKLYSNETFRDNWTVILAMNLNNDGIDDIFFYDPITGEGEFYTYKDAKLGLITKISGFRKTWKTIEPIDFNGDGVDELLFYDPIAGSSELLKINIDKKKLDLVKGWPEKSWRANWKTFIPMQLDADAAQELFLYDPVTGSGEYLDFAADGSVKSLLKQSGFRKQWTVIRAVNLNNDGISDLFFYDPTTGVGEFYTTNDKQKLTLVSSNPSYRKNWRTIIVGNFGSGLKDGDMFLYDPVSGEAEYYQITSKGTLKLLAEKNSSYRKSWAIILKGKFSEKSTNSLMFYESPKYKENFKTIFGVNPY